MRVDQLGCRLTLESEQDGRENVALDEASRAKMRGRVSTLRKNLYEGSASS